jgi:3-hydroxyisobutyrate dehydrogenase-like beta-hydroxyacid dehydrogenase
MRALNWRSKEVSYGRKHSDFDAGLIFETLTRGSGDSFALRNHGMKAILPEDFPTRAFSVQYARKDLGYALEMAAQLGIPMRGAQAVDETFARAIAAGEGERYWPVIAHLIEQERRAIAIADGTG